MKLTISLALWLRNNFMNLSDSALANKFGISIRSVRRWRRRLELLKESTGFLGKRHKADAIEKISRHNKNMWKDITSKVNSKSYRQGLSDRMFKFNKTRPKENMYSRAKRGYRKDIGKGKVYFRSSWEANYARYLDLLKKQGLIYKWEFEPDTFWFEKIKRGVRSYTPDFKIWDHIDKQPHYVEVKGYMDPKSKTKIKRMAKYYPNIELLIVDQVAYKWIKNNRSQFIKNWE